MAAASTKIQTFSLILTQDFLTQKLKAYSQVPTTSQTM